MHLYSYIHVQKEQVMDLSMRGQAIAESLKTLQMQIEAAIGKALSCLPILHVYARRCRLSHHMNVILVTSDQMACLNTQKSRTFQALDMIN